MSCAGHHRVPPLPPLYTTWLCDTTAVRRMLGAYYEGCGECGAQLQRVVAQGPPAAILPLVELAWVLLSGGGVISAREVYRVQSRHYPQFRSVFAGMRDALEPPQIVSSIWRLHHNRRHDLVVWAVGQITQKQVLRSR